MEEKHGMENERGAHGGGGEGRGEWTARSSARNTSSILIFEISFLLVGAERGWKGARKALRFTPVFHARNPRGVLIFFTSPRRDKCRANKEK